MMARTLKRRSSFENFSYTPAWNHTGLIHDAPTKLSRRLAWVVAINMALLTELGRFVPTKRRM